MLQLRRDSFVFQDKTVPQILDDIFADYPQAQWRWELADASALRTRSLCIPVSYTHLTLPTKRIV